MTEFDVVEKPVDMILRNGLLYVLGAGKNEIQVFDTKEFEPLGTIKISNDGFSTKFCPVPDSSLVLVSDTKISRYTVFDTDKNRIIKMNSTELPINDIVVGKKIKKLN